MNSFHTAPDTVPFGGTAKVRNIVRAAEEPRCFPTSRAACTLLCVTFPVQGVPPLSVAASYYTGAFWPNSSVEVDPSQAGGSG